MELIIKYDNRKLYSKTLSAYVGTKYVLDLIKTGQENSFTILKHDKDKVIGDYKDITSESLTWIISTLDLSRESATKFIKENV